jgi:hypothetical protein
MASVIAVLALALLGYGCNRPSGSFTIPDVTTKYATNLTSTVTFKHVDSISLHVRGELRGTAYVYAANWPTQSLSGVVDWQTYQDWFETNCTLHYVPDRVSSGNLRIDYWF